MSKETKKALIEKLQKDKKEFVTARFRLSVETQRKSGKRRQLRKSIAKTATKLTALARSKKIVDSTTTQSSV